MVFLLWMKFSNVFLFLAFIAIGYAIYPVVHPKIAGSAAGQIIESGAEAVQEKMEEAQRSVAPKEKIVEPVASEGEQKKSEVENKQPVVAEVTPVIAKVEPAVVPKQEVVEESAEDDFDPFPAEGVMSEEDKKIVRQAMKGSLVSGKVTEFTVDQVKSVEVEGIEKHGGVEYMVGSVMIESVTLFGERKEKAIALVQGDQVEKWLWMPSELEVK